MLIRNTLSPDRAGTTLPNRGAKGDSLMATKTVSFEIKRQANPEAPAVWERFELEWRPGMNVISAMMEIAANPVTSDGHATTPITYDSNCLEEICGSCAMRINGKARMACSALVDNLEQPIKVEPLSKFPLVQGLAGGPVGAVRQFDGGEGLGSGGWNVRSGLGTAGFSAGAGGELPAFELHFMHVLHGGLPAIQ